MKEKLIPLSILAMALAVVIAVAVWGVVTDREGQRRDQPPWGQDQRRTSGFDTSNTATPTPRDCTRPKKAYDPDFGPGGAFDTGRDPRMPVPETQIDAIIYRGCPPPDSTR